MLNSSDSRLAQETRARFRAWGFSEAGLAEPPGEDDPRGILAALFLQSASQGVERVRALLGDEGFDSLNTVGLLSSDSGQCRANVLLYPLHGLVIASDFPAKAPSSDFVFPAISGQTHEYLSILPATPCGSLLEVGTGSGAAALLAADYADQVVATDISPRCLAFAEFNRVLNGVENVRIVESDAYEGLGDATFDRIIAHPPYVPWTGDQEIYRHGGADGEAVLRKLVQDLPRRLAPGGRCYISAMGADTAAAPLETRLREMLGDSSSEFDVVLVEREILKPIQFILPWTEGEEMTFEEAWSLHEAFRERGIRRLVRCSIVMVHGGAGKTLRMKAGEATQSSDIEAALEVAPKRWLDWSEIRELRPTLRPDVRLESKAFLDGGEWRAGVRVLESPGPFAFRTDCPQWAVEALPLLDGSRSIEEVVGRTVDADEAEALFGCLIDAGVVFTDS